MVIVEESWLQQLRSINAVGVNTEHERDVADQLGSRHT